MRSYSFIEPKIKPIFSLFSKIWIALIICVFMFLVAINLGINFYAFKLERQSGEKQIQYNDYLNKIAQIKDTTAKLKVQRDAALEVYASNNVLKKSLHNIFDLVPDTITLSDIALEKDALKLSGVTPSKETYSLLMEAPLKSIFTSTQTNFYQQKNGWYNFTSISKIIDSEGSNE